jgi:hypothetical protein
MIGTPAIRNLIRENKVAQMYSAIQTGQSLGMQTLDQCLTDLVRATSSRPAEGACQGASFPRRTSRADAWAREPIVSSTSPSPTGPALGSAHRTAIMERDQASKFITTCCA